MLKIMPKIASRRAAVLGVLLVSGVFVFWSAVCCLYRPLGMVDSVNSGILPRMRAMSSGVQV